MAMAEVDSRYPGNTTTAQPPKVLVVNADPAKVRRMAVAIRNEGFLALEASSFADAKRLFDSEFPQAMIVDVRLGAFNGLQLLIRARMVRCDIPVLVTSEFPDPMLETEARRFGARFQAGPVNILPFLGAIPSPMWAPFPDSSFGSSLDTPRLPRAMPRRY